MHTILIRRITIVVFAVLATFCSIRAQSIVNENGSIFILGNASIYVTGGIENKSNAVLQNSGSLYVSDTFTNQGILRGGGKILFYGNGAKSLNARDSFSNKLFVNQTGDLLLLNDIVFTDSIYIDTLSKLNLNERNINIRGNVSGGGAIKGNALSSLTIGGSGDWGSLKMDQSIPGVTNIVNSLVIDRASAGSVTLNNTLEIKGTLDLRNGTLYTGNHLVLKSTSLLNTASILP